jgi:hypothetical protein
VLLRHALPCKLTTSGVFPAHLCRIGSGSSFPSYASCKSGHLLVTFASNAIASSYSGLPINRVAVQNALTRMVPQNSFSILYSDFYRGFNHISIFNKEILGPSKTSLTNGILTSLTVLVTEGRTQVERKAGLQKLRLITDHIMLRRMKQDHTSSMELPPKR